MHYQLGEMRREGDWLRVTQGTVCSGFRSLETGHLIAFPKVGEPCRAACSRITAPAQDRLVKRACRELARTSEGKMWAQRLGLPRSLGEEVAELVERIVQEGL
jgi:hypothetical protein